MNKILFGALAVIPLVLAAPAPAEATTACNINAHKPHGVAAQIVGEAKSTCYVRDAQAIVETRSFLQVRLGTRGHYRWVIVFGGTHALYRDGRNQIATHTVPLQRGRYRTLGRQRLTVPGVGATGWRWVHSGAIDL